jgi:hypothetical protein
MEPRFVRFENVAPLELVEGVTGRPLFGEGTMLNALVIDGVAHELGPMEGYVLPGGVEHSAYCGPEGAFVIDVFHPVREDYRERWEREGGSGAGEA